MRQLFTLSAAVLALSMASASADTEFPAKLVGHALLPAETFIQPPADAPAQLRISGQFTNLARAEGMGTVMGRSSGRPTGVRVPFFGQPVQGHSGIKRMRDGTFWVLTDNGFGSKPNSPDTLLRMYALQPQWRTSAGGSGSITAVDFNTGAARASFARSGGGARAAPSRSSRCSIRVAGRGARDAL
jgi:hypothetical protein